MSLLPPHVHEFLYAGGTWRMPGDDEAPCEGARFHSPRPLTTRTVRLVPEDWYDEPSVTYWADAPQVNLCGTCEANLSILLQMLHAVEGDLDWPIRREFGNEIRALAYRGWEWFTEHRPAQPAESPTKG